MFHEYAAKERLGVPALRKLHPGAAIIRKHADGAATVFDEAGDALGHWSARSTIEPKKGFKV